MAVFAPVICKHEFPVAGVREYIGWPDFLCSKAGGTMVTVKLDNYSVVVSGHAGYSRGGQDIVCAGISALTHALGIALEKRGRLKGYSYREDSGMAVMIWAGEPTETANILIEAYIDGLREIQREYPMSLSIDTEAI